MKTDRLASLYSDPGPFASVHLDVSRDMENGNRVVELGARAARESLAEQGAPEKLAGRVSARLAESVHAEAPVSRLVVASENGILLDALTANRTPRATATWSALPDVGAWLAQEDSVVPFVLALVDHEGGDVAVFRSGNWTPDAETSIDEPDVHEHKIAGGGWSHLRYQRVSENVWARNAEAVVEQINLRARSGIDVVVLAGDVKSRSEVTARLAELGAELVELESGGRQSDGGDEALRGLVQEALHRHLVGSRLAQVHQLQAQVGRGDSAAVGVKDVLDALVRGQVERLLLDVDLAKEVTVQPADYPGLALGSIAAPPSARADQVLIAAATLTDAEIVVTRARTLGGAPVAALLRWDQSSATSS